MVEAFLFCWGGGGGGGGFLLIGQKAYPNKTRGVSHCGLAIYFKKVSKGKRRMMEKLKYFTIQKYNLKKIL
jgi:predicted YcjX-like family ATPase